MKTIWIKKLVGISILVGFTAFAETDPPRKMAKPPMRHSMAPASPCLETETFEESAKELPEKVTQAFTKDGWAPLKGKKIVGDFDHNGKKDYAFLLKKDDQLKAIVIWDGEKTSIKNGCPSEVYAPAELSSITSDACKLNFLAFKHKSQDGILFRISRKFMYKFVCEAESKGSKEHVWNNIGSPD